MELYLSKFLKQLPQDVVVDLYIYDEFVDPFKYERISSNDFEKFLEDDYIVLSSIKNSYNSYELEVCK